MRPIDADALLDNLDENCGDLDLQYNSEYAKLVHYIDSQPTLDYAPVRHGEWIKTKKHIWKQDEEGNVDTWAWERGYHNGPRCIICSASPCEHCNPDYEELKNCYEHYVCSECGRMVISLEPYCHCGAKMDWKELPS